MSDRQINQMIKDFIRACDENHSALYLACARIEMLEEMGVKTVEELKAVKIELEAARAELTQAGNELRDMGLRLGEAKAEVARLKLHNEVQAADLTNEEKWAQEFNREYSRLKDLLDAQTAAHKADLTALELAHAEIELLKGIEQVTHFRCSSCGDIFPFPAHDRDGDELCIDCANEVID